MKMKRIVSLLFNECYFVSILPDVRDGMKPVYRRILFAMNELGMSFDKPYKSQRESLEKSCRSTTHTEILLYMEQWLEWSQDFNYSISFNLWTWGSFGSIDGDSAAAMRYTEARMAKQ